MLMYLQQSSHLTPTSMHQSPVKVPVAAAGSVLPSSLSHTSPMRHISRRSSSPGRQLDCDAAALMTMDHPVSGTRMTQSFVNAGPGLLSMGSSASLMQYHYGAGANGNRSASGSFSGHKTKSLSLLVDRAAADSSNSNRRRMVGSAASHASSVDQSTVHAAVLSSSNNSMSYDRDQSLDRHVERRHRQRSQREGIVNDNVSRYHTISGYGRDRGMSADREYPHMGARALERVENGLMRSRSIDPEIVPAEQPVLFSSENTHHSTQDVMLELQSQVTDLNKECSALQRDLEGTREKLASSMNSVRTFWSPELKRERALRKEDSSKLSLMVEQLRMAEVENRQLLENIKHLDKENRTLREFSLSNCRVTQSDENRGDVDTSQKDREKHVKELKLLKRTIEEMELRIETQKQTLATRDESIHKLMEMLQAKVHARSHEESSEEGRHIRQLEQLLEQKEAEMETRVRVVEGELSESKAELSRLKKLELLNDNSQLEGLKNREKELKIKVESSKAELGRSEAAMHALQAKVDTLEKHQEDHNRHISVLRQQLSAKEEQVSMLQSEVDLLHDRIREKDDVAEKKAKVITALQADKKRLELESVELCSQAASKEKEVTTLQRKIESLDEMMADKHTVIASLKMKLQSLEADQSASGDALSGLETLLSDKDKQIEKLKQQRERADQRFDEEKEITNRKMSDLKSRIESLLSELAEKQKTESEVREELLRLKSERLMKESQISRLELDLSEKIDQLTGLQLKLEQEREEKELAKGTNADKESCMTELRKELELQRAETSRIKVETSHLSAALRDAEASKQLKDRQIKQLQEKLNECEQKIVSLQDQVDRTVSGTSSTSDGNHDSGVEDINVLKSLIHDRDDRIAELEEALRESIRITAQREVVMAEQQMKQEHTERMLESLHEEIESIRKAAAENEQQLQKARSQLTEKEDEFVSLQADSKKQLIEVYEMKQEAILAAISEKDAHIALLEMAPNKKTENIEEVEKLSREKLRLQQVLKDLTHSRMKLLHSRHLRSQSHDGSAASLFKSESYEKEDDAV